MSISYVRKNRQVLASEILGRDIFINELGDLSDQDLARLIAEAEVTTASLKADHDELDPADEGRIHVRHKRNIFKTYHRAALIEQRLRGIDAGDRFFDLVADRLGRDAATELRKQAATAAG